MLESVKSGAEQHTNPEATVRANNSLIIGGHIITQSSTPPQSIELPDAEACETLSGSTNSHSLDNDEGSSNSADYGATDVTQSAEAQTLHGQPGKLRSSERVDSIATED